MQHFSSWPPPYVPETPLKFVFDLTGYADLNEDTMLDALNYQGGSTDEEAAQILLRVATGAVLNAASGLNYPMSVPQIESAVDDALASADRDQILNLATTLDRFNNSSCPLN